MLAVLLITAVTSVVAGRSKQESNSTNTVVTPTSMATSATYKDTLRLIRAFLDSEDRDGPSTFV